MMLSRMLSSVLLLSLISNAGLMWVLRDKNNVLSQQTQTLKEQENAILELRNQAINQEKKCNLGQDLSRDFLLEQKKLSNHAQKLIKQVGDMNATKENGSVDLDGRLPTGAVRLLQQSYTNNNTSER